MLKYLQVTDRRPVVQIKAVQVMNKIYVGIDISQEKLILAIAWS